MTDYWPVPFYFKAPKNSNASQASLLISGIKKISHGLLIWPQGTGLLLWYRFFQDTTPKLQSTGLPGGHDLTEKTIQTSQWTGDGYAYRVRFDQDPIDTEIALKMYAQNDSGTDYQAAAVIWVAI